MIELPESRCLANQFSKILKGKTVQNVTANKSPHKFAFFHGEPAEYHARLAGKTVSGADAFGGVAELQFEDLKLAFYDGVNVRYYTEGDVIPQKHQLHIEFADFSSIICTIQMYGFIALMDKNNEEGHYAGSKYKIKPLQPEFDEPYFDGLIKNAKPTLSAKAFLATEQRIPGLGNGVLQDILFNARIHPKRKLRTLSDVEKEAMYKSINQTLSEMTAGGGRDTEKNIYGADGGYKTKLSAKTINSPCVVCAGTIVREAYMGGNIYFCPICQKPPEK
jgi:formamidopyrimidine-DNA glycosylase